MLVCLSLYASTRQKWALSTIISTIAFTPVRTSQGSHSKYCIALNPLQMKIAHTSPSPVPLRLCKFRSCSSSACKDSHTHVQFHAGRCGYNSNKTVIAHAHGGLFHLSSFLILRVITVLKMMI